MLRLFEWITGKAALPIMVMLLAANLGQWSFHRVQQGLWGSQLKKANETISQKQGTIDSLNSQVKNLKEAIETQTLTINALEESSREKSEAAEKELKFAQEYGERWKKKFDTILRVPVSADQCKSLSIMLDSYWKARQVQSTEKATK